MTSLRELTASDCLQLLAGVDRGEIVPISVSENNSIELRISFMVAEMEVIRFSGGAIGVALHGRTGGTLVRRGHATSKKIVLNSTQKLNFYWITEAGRLAARSEHLRKNMKINKIVPKEQEGVLSSFWMMLGECETLADNENDALLKHQVAQWYQQWNRITGDTKEPRWLTREKSVAAKAT